MANPFIHPTYGPLHLGRPRVSVRTNQTDRKKIALHDFMATLPTPPDAIDNTFDVTDWTMMANDTLGDCTEATKGHLVTVYTDGKVILPTDVIVQAYEDECGYNPADPLSDQGGDIAKVLEYFRTQGLGGHKILAHAEVNITQLRLEQAVQAFRAVNMGIQMPVTAQKQTGPGKLWDIVQDCPNTDADPGSWGGHSTPIVKYDATGVWLVTWGLLQKATWQWLMYYSDEAHACISPDWTSPVPTDELVADLQAVGK